MRFTGTFDSIQGARGKKSKLEKLTLEGSFSRVAVDTPPVFNMPSSTKNQQEYEIDKAKESRNGYGQQ